MTLSRLLRIAVSAGFATAIISSASAAQFVFEARQGTTWGQKLVVPENTAMSFRWKWDGRTDLTSASWQMTYSIPATRDEPTIVKSAAVSVSTSRLSEYSAFQISPDAVPSNAPSTFYVRVRSGQLHSSWIPVTVTSPTPAGPLTVVTVPSTDPALWVKLTKIICKAQSADGSASDEVYALFGSVGINHEKPWTSTFLSQATQIYQGMNANDFRSVNSGLWGPPAGDPVVFRKPGDVILHYWLVEHDAGSPELAKAMGLGGLSKMVGTFNTDWSYARMVQNAGAAYSNAAQQAFLGTGSTARDDEIGTGVLVFTQAEIDAARSGTVQKKEVLVGSGDRGVYLLRFQMGRAGTSTEAW